MRKVVSWGVAVLVAFGLIGTAFSAEPAAQSDKSTKTGIVKKVDVAGKKVVVMVTRELAFSITAETQILQGETAKTLADIKEGDSVTVDYKRIDKDTRVATKVAIAAPSAAVAPASAAPAK